MCTTHMKYPGQLKLGVNPSNYLEQNLNCPYVSIIAIPKVNVLRFDCNSLVAMSDSFEHLG